MAVGRHDGETASPLEVELVPQSVGEPQDAAGVLGERGVVLAVVKADGVCPPLEGRQQNPAADELLHGDPPPLPATLVQSYSRLAEARATIAASQAVRKPAPDRSDNIGRDATSTHPGNGPLRRPPIERGGGRAGLAARRESVELVRPARLSGHGRRGGRRGRGVRLRAHRGLRLRGARITAGSPNATHSSCTWIASSSTSRGAAGE